MRLRICKALKKMEDFNNIAEIDIIARRYFTLNTFDGILTALGITLASFFTGIIDRKIILISCMGAAIAIAVSGFYGAYTTEKAERSGEMRKLEKAVGLDLSKTPIQDAHDFAVFVLAMIEGFSPFLIITAIISPFFIFSSMYTAYYFAFGISLVFLFLIGMFQGTISKESLVKSGLKMLMAGVICAAILFGMKTVFNL